MHDYSPSLLEMAQNASNWHVVGRLASSAMSCHGPVAGELLSKRVEIGRRLRPERIERGDVTSL